jgi:uncharacterized protein (DUF302 family)
MLKGRDFVVGAVTAAVAVTATLATASYLFRGHESKGPMMNPRDVAEADLVTLPSAHGATQTIERLKSLLAQKNIRIFADIDHAAAATEVGLDLRPTRVLIFGNPQAGTPLMQSRQTIGLDLPLRILVWEDEAGKVWLTYRRLEYLAQRHAVFDREAAVNTVGGGLAALAKAATAP